MATSTFGKPNLFHPTPSTCYPPPPPPPLPYDVPCLRGTNKLPLQHTGWIRLRRTTAFGDETLQIDTSGVPLAGNAGNNQNWTLNLASANLLWATLSLTCVEVTPMIHFWRYRINGVAITPTGTFCPFDRLNNGPAPNDNSIPDNWNDINITDIMTGHSPDNWHAALEQSQWYTTGAPTLPPV